jgi:dihydrofolate synthase/folylpolyglutamate synthase
LPDSSLLPADVDGWLQYLEKLHPKHIALGLERVCEVRHRLGLHPRFAIITVAGTNGKGSTCAMLERIYLEAGHRVACYTSPHLLRYNERVRVDGTEVSDAELCAAFCAVEQARQATPLTYFEFGTLAALWHFIQANVDVAILEVGLGGRLDAVNVFDPDCAIVTSIDLDHVEYLGNSRESIGREKAGIFRRGVPALCGDPHPPSTVSAYASEIEADFQQIGVDFRYALVGREWEFHAAGMCYRRLPLPALDGSFQIGNAACAMAAVHCLQARLPVSATSMANGLKHVRLPGRFQSMGGKPEIILDVAHNPHAARGLAENLRNRPHGGRTLAVFAMLRDKDIAGVVRELADSVDAWYVAGIQTARGAEAQALAGLVQAIPGAHVYCSADVTAAFRLACMSAGENDRIIVFGSFYTVADVLGSPHTAAVAK